MLVHAGNLGFAGNWETLLTAVGLLEQHGVGMTFVGDGAARSVLESRARGMSNVQFLPFYPPEDVPHVLASADLQVICLRKGLEGLVVPSKLYPILMAGKPVLAIAHWLTDGSALTKRLLERFRLRDLIQDHQFGG